MSFEAGLMTLLVFSMMAFVCLLSMGVRRMRDICMSSRGIWTYFGIVMVITLLLAQVNESIPLKLIFGLGGLIIALLPTNSLLKYKNTALGRWFVDSSLENIVDTHNIQS